MNTNDMTPELTNEMNILISALENINQEIDKIEDEIFELHQSGNQIEKKLKIRRLKKAHELKSEIEGDILSLYVEFFEN